jgi:type VI secretion system protein ImpA
MSVPWKGDALLQPITADQPCGENLEDTPLFSALDALRLFGQAKSPEAPPDPEELDKGRQPPDWGALQSNAADALAKSKDLRLLAYLGTALLRTDGLRAFFETLTVASNWLETYWAHVYPLIEDDDAIARRNALNCFADPMAVVERVRRMPLVESRQHGRFGLRDVDLATGQVAPSAGEIKPDEGPINAAFHEMPLEELRALHQGVTGGVAALTSIDAKMRSEGGPEVVPDFDPLSAQLAKMHRLLRDQLASHPGATAADANGTAGEQGAAFSSGVVKSRQDAIRSLEAVADFFRRNEPSSPIPLFLERAKRLVSKDFLEVLADIAPDALPVARAAGGLRDEA